MHILTERPIFGAGAAHAARGPGEMKGETGGTPSDQRDDEIQKNSCGWGEWRQVARL